MEFREGGGYYTRAGSKAVIYNTVGRGERPLHGAYYTGEEWIPCSWDLNGRFHGTKTTSLDLVEDMNLIPAAA